MIVGPGGGLSASVMESPWHPLVPLVSVVVVPLEEDRGRVWCCCKEMKLVGNVVIVVSPCVDSSCGSHDDDVRRGTAHRTNPCIIVVGPTDESMH